MVPLLLIISLPNVILNLVKNLKNGSGFVLLSIVYKYISDPFHHLMINLSCYVYVTFKITLQTIEESEQINSDQTLWKWCDRNDDFGFLPTLDDEDERRLTSLIFTFSYCFSKSNIKFFSPEIYNQKTDDTLCINLIKNLNFVLKSIFEKLEL